MGNLRDSFRVWEKLRRQRFRALTSRFFASLTRSGHPPLERLDASQIREVLLVRMNERMGNTLFMTPLIAALHEVMPEAAIDVYVSYPDAPDLLAGLPGVRDVIRAQAKRWWRLRETIASIRALRARRYDLVVEPSLNSSSGRIAMMIARSRWRLGFGGEEQWHRLDFAAVPPEVRHEALRPLALVEQAFGLHIAPGSARLRIGNTPEELAAGAHLLRERLARGARPPRAGVPVIGFFASARGPKDLGAEWWRAFWAAYLERRPDTVPIEVLPTASQPALREDLATVHCASPRALAATVAGVDWFFSADTGPMHLASAAGVPTIAFFDKTRPDAFGPIKPNDVVIRIGGLTPQAVAAACADIVERRGDPA
ncbi:MAG TPA: glycosyltransferase family 9 protein [Steroidobacteraceae bacterium]|nr:glycosyltransferase family 9 protein [Steroidobacteraceae bacterium]